MNLYAKKQNFLGRNIIISVVVLVVLVGFLNMFQTQVRNSFFWASAPVSKVLLQTGKSTSGFFGAFFHLASLDKENSALKTENQSLLASLSSLQEAIKSNQDLRGALENTKNDNFNLLEAKVTGLDVQNDTMLVDKGSKNGISENMPVISQEKVLFGKITKVYPNFSEITLISNKKSALAVKIQNVDPVKPPLYAALKGSGSLAVYMDLIPANSTINQGDVLVTSGQEGVFPKDLLIGKTESLNMADSKAFQTAKVQAFFDPKNTDNIFIITNYLKR